MTAGTLPRGSHGTRGRSDRMAAADALLLRDVPADILGSYPVLEFGLLVGMSVSAARWREQIVTGDLPDHEMRASIIALASLLSAMLEALLRAAPIDRRSAAFETLADESNRILTGRPQAVIIQAGIL
jgi:hypothetical protein